MKIEKKKRAITDLNAPDDSRDIPFHSQEFGQDRYRHFVGFQPHYLSKKEAKNLQNGDVHLAQIPDFEMGYLEKHLAH